jgi:hypothetical protein
VQKYCSFSYSSNMNMATHVHIHIRRIWPFFPYSYSTNIREYEYEYEFIEYSCIPGAVYPPLVHCTPHFLRRTTVLFPSYLSPIPLPPHVLRSPTTTLRAPSLPPSRSCCRASRPSRACDAIFSRHASSQLPSRSDDGRWHRWRWRLCWWWR